MLCSSCSIVQQRGTIAHYKKHPLRSNHSTSSVKFCHILILWRQSHYFPSSRIGWLVWEMGMILIIHITKLLRLNGLHLEYLKWCPTHTRCPCKVLIWLPLYKSGNTGWQSLNKFSEVPRLLWEHVNFGKSKVMSELMIFNLYTASCSFHLAFRWAKEVHAAFADKLIADS